MKIKKAWSDSGTKAPGQPWPHRANRLSDIQFSSLRSNRQHHIRHYASPFINNLYPRVAQARRSINFAKITTARSKSQVQIDHFHKM